MAYNPLQNAKSNANAIETTVFPNQGASHATLIIGTRPGCAVKSCRVVYAK